MTLCKICKENLKTVISFGTMPVANGFINTISETEYSYELKLMFCPQCYMVQLGEFPKPDLMFNQGYHFISQTSKVMTEHFRMQAEEILKKIKNKNSPFVVELGCNDGIMLQYIAKKGIYHLGVEPSKNVAELARKNGISVLVDFFDEKIAKKIVHMHGQADIICASNTMCSVDNLNSAFQGFRILLKPHGIVFFEDPYIYDIVTLSSFDQIYDEHIYYYSGLSVRQLAQRHHLQLTDMEHQDVHGGSMRYYLMNENISRVKVRVHEFIQKEKEIKLDTIDGFISFQKRVNRICKDLKKLLMGLKKQKLQIVGYGATSKSTTLLNYAKIGCEIIDYITDNTPTKIGKYTPGMHIPIKSHDIFIQDNPPYCVLFAWNHKKEIFEKEKNYRLGGGKFITYFPKVIIE